MATVSISVPNPDAADVLAALEQHWSRRASLRHKDYSSLSATGRAGACIAEYLREITKGYRRTKEVQRRKELESPIVIAEPDIV